jgi:hypothetical protein
MRNVLKRTFLGAMSLALLLFATVSTVEILSTSPVSATPASTPAPLQWSVTTSGTPYDWSAIASGSSANVSNYFVAVGASGDIGYSTDGSAWEITTTPAGLSGKIWTTVAADTSGELVAFAADGTQIYSTTNGQSWSQNQSAPSNVTAVTYVSQLGFLAVGSNGTIYLSFHGSGTWTTLTNISGVNFTNVAASNGVLIAIGTSGRSAVSYSSTNGVTWASVSIPNKQWVSVTAGPAEGSFLALSADGWTASSSNGGTWTLGSSSLGPYMGGITYGNGTYVAVSQNSPSSGALSSADGSTWVAGSSTDPGYENDDWTAVAYGDGLYVAVSAQDTMVAGQTLGTPTAPTFGDVWAGANGNGTTWISIAASSSSGGSPITNYVIAAVDPNNHITSCSIPPTPQATVFSCFLNLTEGVVYRVSAIAVNAIGNSPQSSVLQVYTMTPISAHYGGAPSQVCFPGFKPFSTFTIQLVQDGYGQGAAGGTTDAQGNACVSVTLLDPHISVNGGTPISVPGGTTISLTATGIDPDGAPYSATQGIFMPAVGLASTGTDFGPYVLASAGMMVLGLGIVAVHRRRRLVEA